MFRFDQKKVTFIHSKKNKDAEPPSFWQRVRQLLLLLLLWNQWDQSNLTLKNMFFVNIEFMTSS